MGLKTKQIGLRIVPLFREDAQALVALFHRHHRPAIIPSATWSIGVVREDTGKLVGAALLGRPVSLFTPQIRWVLEVSRVVTDGTPNACSALYGGCARLAKALGYWKVQTFTLPEEGGTSLRAAGWTMEEVTKGTKVGRHESRFDYPMEPKTRWAVIFESNKPLDYEMIAASDGDVWADPAQYRMKNRSAPPVKQSLLLTERVRPGKKK